MIEWAVVARLKADGPTAALMGDRIFAQTAPASTAKPFVVYQRISANRVRSLSGPSGSSLVRLQIDAYAESYGGAKTLAAAIRIALDGYRGTVTVPTSPETTVRVQASSLDTDRDFYDDGALPRLHRVSADYLIRHVET